MRPAALEFARDVAANFPIGSPVIEMGARVAAGQEDTAGVVRALFGAHEYIACDLQPGPGVDRIEDIHRLGFATASVGTVLALETLEHVADPIRAVQEMYRVLRPGGVLAMSSLMFFPIHAHPWDYWRFTPEAFELLLAPFPSRLVLAQGCPDLPEGIFGVGVKGPMTDLSAAKLPRTHHLAQTWADGLDVDFGPIRMTTRQLWGYTLSYTAKALRRRAARLGRVFK